MHLGAVRQQGIGDHNKLAPGANSPIPRSIRRSRPTAIRSGLGRSRREARLTVGERLVGIECRVLADRLGFEAGGSLDVPHARFLAAIY